MAVKADRGRVYVLPARITDSMVEVQIPCFQIRTVYMPSPQQMFHNKVLELALLHAFSS